MKDKKRTISLVAKVIGGIAFLFVFVLNIMLFVRKDSDRSILSLAALKAYAQTGGESVVETGDPNCPYYVEIIYDEHYGYTTTQCCQQIYEHYIDKYECYLGDNCPCPGRQEIYTETLVGSSCCA